MNIFKKIASISIIGAFVLVSNPFHNEANIAHGASWTDVPFYNNSNVLDVNGNQMRRVDDTAEVNPVLGRYRYPTLVNGTWDNYATNPIDKRTAINSSFTVSHPPNMTKTGANPRTSIPKAYEGFKFLHLVPQVDNPSTAQQYISADLIDSSSFVSVLGGHPDNMVDLQKYTLISGSNDYGIFYHIANLAEVAGGVANSFGSSDSANSVNPTWSRILRTSYPTVKTFEATNSTVTTGSAVKFKLDGFEYSASSSGVSYSITINSSSAGNGTLSTSPSTDSSMQNESYSKKYTGSSIGSYTPTTAGTYTAKIVVTDGVKRPVEATTTFTVTGATKAGVRIVPPENTVEVGGTANYKLMHTDTNGKETDVTESATWSITSAAIGKALSTKGAFEGIAVGSSPVKATYTGLSAEAKLNVIEEKAKPEVTIYGPTKVKAGEEFDLFAAAQVLGGTIDQYIWDHPGSDGAKPDKQNLDNLYYMTEGVKYVSVSVEDNNNQWAHDEHYIDVLPPTPVAAMNIEGTLKENRKVTISSSSSTPKYFPMTDSYFTIEPLDGQNVTSIKSIVGSVINNKFTVSNNNNMDLLFRETGRYRIYHYVQNTAGLSDEVESIITIDADKKPIADFSVVTTLYREDVKEQPEHSKTIIKITDKSNSPDDVIGKRIWTYRYDSNNDGNFKDEDTVIIDDTNKTEVEINNVEKVGKYLIELKVFEDFGQPTIEQFVDLSYVESKTDRRFQNTGSKTSTEKIVEVKNLAPVVGFDVVKRKTVDLQVFVGNYENNTTQMHSKIMEQLKPILNENKIDLNLNVRTMEISDSRITSIPEEFIDYQTANNLDFTNYDYFVKSHAGQIDYTGYDSSGRKVWNQSNGVGAMVPSNLGITKVNVDGWSGLAKSAITRRAKNIANVNTNGQEFIGFDIAYNPDFANYTYFIKTTNPNSIDYWGKNSVGTKVWSAWYASSQQVPENLGITSFGIDGYSGIPLFVLTRTLKGFSPNISIQPMNGSNNFVAFFENKSLYSSSINSINQQMKTIDANFIGVGTSANQSQMQSIISTNGKGKFLSNTNADNSIKQISDYIISEVNKDSIRPDLSKIDLSFSLGDTTHKDKNVLQSKINSIIKPKLNSEGISIASLSILDIKLNSIRADENYWEFHEAENATFGYEWTVPSTRHIYQVILTGASRYENTFYATRRDNGQQVEIARLFYEGNAQATLLVDGSTYSKVWGYNSLGGNNTGRALVINKKAIPNSGIASNGYIWQFHEVNNGSFGYGWTVPTSQTYKVTLTGASRYENTFYATRRDNGQQVEIARLFYEGNAQATLLVDGSTYSKVWGYNSLGGNNTGRALVITKRVDDIPNSINMNLKNTSNLQFATIVEDNAISAANSVALSNQTLTIDAYLVGFGRSVNKSTFQSMINRNLDRGTFIENNNIDEALNQYADYIIATIKEKSSMHELYLTLDEQAVYKTYYEDAENDPKLTDRWKYDHNQNVYENNTGQDDRQMRELASPIEKFLKVGRYRPFYSAKDDPLNTLFPTNIISSFEDYRLWAKDADNWYIYVHRKPVPEFSFTMDKVTRAYTLTNEAYDMDKYSINIGLGPGIKKQAFTWRIKGETAWKAGLPPSPLSLTVYEVKNTVTDFQNREESRIKEMNATGLNVPPIPEFEIIPDRIPQNTIAKPKNFSWDPNGDAINGYQWEWKKKGEADTAFVNIPGTTNIKEPNIPFNVVGTFVIRLKVKDVPGLWSAPPREWHSQEVEVYSPNTAPIAGFKVTPQLYIGQKIEIVSEAVDPDGDELAYEYTVQPPNEDGFILKSGESYTDRKGNIINIASNGNFAIQTYDRTDLGMWTFKQKVTDPMGASDTSETKQSIVLDLTVTGQVLHTEAWQKIHESKENAPDEFYSGEKFILAAEVLPLPIKAVTASVTGRLENNTNFSATIETFTKDEVNAVRYNAEYFEEQFAEIGTQIRTGSNVQFIFTATYENGTPEGYSVTDTVDVTIIGSGLGLLDFHQSN